MLSLIFHKDDQQLGQEDNSLLKQILGFAGAKATSRLSQTNRFWRQKCEQEEIWEELCLTLGKKKSVSAFKTSITWKQCYLEHLCVPFDFPTLHSAVQFANQEFEKAALAATKNKTIYILVERKQYDIQETLTINAVGVDARLVVDILDLVEDMADADLDLDSSSEDDDVSSSSWSSLSFYQSTLAMDTDVYDQPLLRLTAGTLDLKNTKLEHCSPGTANIMDRSASGYNAALLIDINNSDNNSHKDCYSANLILDNVTIQSFSGKGIVNRAGCQVVMENSHVLSPHKYWQ